MLFVLVPVKPFGHGKSRLAPHLDREQRAALSRSLLLRVLHAVNQAACFDGCVVVSRDAEVLSMAAANGARPLRETAEGLNPALEQARAFAVALGAQALLVLPADLPSVEALALRALVAQAAALGEGVLIVPSTSGGTNALLLQPPDAIPFAYGPQSAARHTRLALARGRRVHILDEPSLAIDVDLPADLPPELARDLALRLPA